MSFIQSNCISLTQSVALDAYNTIIQKQKKQIRHISGSVLNNRPMIMTGARWGISVLLPK